MSKRLKKVCEACLETIPCKHNIEYEDGTKSSLNWMEVRDTIRRGNVCNPLLVTRMGGESRIDDYFVRQHFGLDRI